MHGSVEVCLHYNITVLLMYIWRSKIRDVNLILLKNNIFTTYALGHLLHNSSQIAFVIIHPKPGKKSVRYNNSGLFSSTRPTLPLSFHADTHQSVGSFSSNGYVPRKYSKKSGATSRSSKDRIT